MRFRRSILAIVTAVALSGCAFVARASSPTPPPTGGLGNGESAAPSISRSGRFVAFSSLASNLVPGDTNNVSDVFVHDFVTKATTRVSVGSDGSQATGASRAPDISDDGRFVAFETDAPNLTAGDTDTTTDIVVRDRTLGTTTLASVTTTGAPIVDPTVRPVLSGDGHVVAFVTRTVFQAVTVDVGPSIHNVTTGVTRTVANALFPTSVALSDDGSRILYTQLTPDITGQNATFSVQVVASDTSALIAGVASGTLTHESQGSVLATLSGDGTTVALILQTPNTGQLTVSAVSDPAHTPTFSVPIRSAAGVALSDDGASLTVRAVTDASQYGLFTRIPGATTLRLTSTDAVGKDVGAVDGFDYSGDGKWIAIAVVGPGMLADDTNGFTDVYLRSVNPSLTGP